MFRRLLPVLGVLLSAALSSQAQNKMELFGGYSYMRLHNSPSAYLHYGLSFGVNSRVFRANGSERMLVLLNVKTARIRTKEVDLAVLSKLVAELFEPNCGFFLTLRPQKNHSFSKNRNPGMFCLRCS